MHSGTATEGLVRSDKARLWARCLVFAIIFAFACGIGMYAVSPDGHFDIGSGTVSHDPHRYRWFFQYDPLLLLEEGVIFGGMFFSLPFAFLLGCVVASLLAYTAPLRPLAWRTLGAPARWFYPSAIVTGWVMGLPVTLITGVFPGLCC